MAEVVRGIKYEIKGLAAVLLALFTATSLLTYNKWDPSPFTYTDITAANYCGIAGSYYADILLSFIGSGAFILPFFLFYYGLRRLIGSVKKKENLVGSFLLLVTLPMVFALVSETFNTLAVTGGLYGVVLINVLKKPFSPVFAYIVTLSVFYTSIAIMLPINLTSISFRRNPKTKGEPIPATAGETHKDNGIEPDFKIIKHKEEPLEDEKKPTVTVRQFKMTPEVREGQYTLPKAELLSSNDTEKYELTREELILAADILKNRLSDFNVEGRISQAHPGPVITMYEFEPAPGVKISKVVSLSDDLGRAMGGIKVRVSLIPGKTPIGIEVPNEKRSVVSLKEIIASDRFVKKSSLLTLCMGKDIYGNPIVEDLARMPHLLVAGTTGSGKSVAINSMIMSILFKAKPSEVKMLMVDPKLLELSIYEGIPHLISNVITSPKEASDALKKMLLEMERRYRLIAGQGARNIEMFNASVTDEEKLPYIIVIIDELADLMFTAAKNVEDSIVRLAQMARASGIHLIVATQRPSVDVITGIIKANFPSRVAFMVSSKVDSRTILDTHGAEKLLGRGDMLMLSPGAKITRVHGAFVDESEIKAVVDFVKSQGRPDYSIFEDLVMEEAQSADTENTVSDKDDVYKDVIRYAQTMGEVSISSIQRRFKIGYNRAARIMDMLDEDGLVGPPKGAGKPRDFVSN
ncbi:DNA translocase FtsK [Candidatus Magnetomonas plexicatena]|uniref:DNA translocase FtsK n=1 Tax=Candidatus Magnetomonas plexicatena TaxID=2552947 RepID=UPI001C754AF6|nr:DNA translocase FtsK [Nitrospirales bacterium LBB_01]